MGRFGLCTEVKNRKSIDVNEINRTRCIESTKNSWIVYKDLKSQSLWDMKAEVEVIERREVLNCFGPLAKSLFMGKS